METMQAQTLALRVFGATSPCPQCARDMLWVIGLHPIHRPQVGELVTVDQDGAVALAAQILRQAGHGVVADRFRSRPAEERGASHNANSCGVCGFQPCWHEYADVVNVALHGAMFELAQGRVTRDLW
jgi:hypothetical protein